MPLNSRTRAIAASGIVAAAMIGLPATALAAEADASANATVHAKASPEFASALGSATVAAHTDYIYT